MALCRCVIVTLLLLSASVHATTCLVTPSGSDSGDGSDWKGQAMDLHTALGEESCTEIWVRSGLYKPGEAGELETSFNIDREVAVYGGFAGDETNLEERDWETHVTILSGDIDNNDVTTDGVVMDADEIVGENSYHVVFVDGTTVNGSITADTVLDGFVITGGLAVGDFPHFSGGGLYCNGHLTGTECSPTLRNLVFSGNSAELGGAITFWDSIPGNQGRTSPVLDNVTFRGNYAFGGGALFGSVTNSESTITLTNAAFQENRAQEEFGHGGALRILGTGPSLTDVVFIGNSAGDRGGAIYIIGVDDSISMPILSNVTFVGNDAGRGGAMFNDNTSPMLTNVTMFGNTADQGGAIYNTSQSNPTLSGVTFSDNSAAQGSAIFNDNTSPTLVNVIIWDHESPGAEVVQNNGNSQPAVRYSIVKGGCPAGSALCENVADQDPLLGPLQNNGHFTPTMLPAENSPVVDAGFDDDCPDHDQRGAERPQGSRCDIGAVELYQFSLAVEVNGPGRVDAKSTPTSGIIVNCDENDVGQANCAAVFPEGTAVALSLSPSPGFSISQIGGNCPPGNLSDNVYVTGPVTADCTVTVNFAQLANDVFADRFEQ